MYEGLHTERFKWGKRLAADNGIGVTDALAVELESSASEAVCSVVTENIKVYKFSREVTVVE